MKRYDLMHQVNARGTFVCSQAALSSLRKGTNPHILNISPPLNMKAKWFRDHCAYTMAKYGMSMCLGMSAEFAGYGIGVNALWPRTCIDTAALNLLGGEWSVGRAYGRDHGRRCPPDPHITEQGVHRKLLHRRRGSCQARYHGSETVCGRSEPVVVA